MTSARIFLAAGLAVIPLLAMTTRTGGNRVVIASSETLDDSLFATGESVRIDGVVNGDVIAFARRIEIRGTVRGSVFLWAQEIEIPGQVEGSAGTFGQTVRMDGSLSGNLLSFGQSVNVGREARVAGDLVGFGSTVSSAGTIVRGTRMFAGIGEVSGTVGRDVVFRGGELRLGDGAKVNGNIEAHVERPEDVTVASGASIAGTIDKRLQKATPPGIAARILWNIVWLIAALVTGWVIWRISPRFVESAVRNIERPWAAVGAGFVLLVVTPAALVIAGLTLIGLPLALMGAAAYGAGLYLSAILVAVWLGRRIVAKLNIGATRFSTLLAGLIVLGVLFAIPILGFAARLVVLCLGLGAAAWNFYQPARVAREGSPVIVEAAGVTLR